MMATSSSTEAAAPEQRERDGAQRAPVGIVGGSVDRVEEPQGLGHQALAAPLLPEERDAGSVLSEVFAHKPLDLDVHDRREAVVALVDQGADVAASPRQRAGRQLDRPLGGEQQAGRLDVVARAQRAVG